MFKFKKVMALLLAVLCIGAMAIPASATPAVTSKTAGGFGTLTGTLSDSGAFLYEEDNLMYVFNYMTEVTKLPGDAATLHANIDILNNDTGAKLAYDRTYYQAGQLFATYDFYLDELDNIRGVNGITVAVFGCHEARYTTSYAVYTQKTYNLYRDHGII